MMNIEVCLDEIESDVRLDNTDVVNPVAAVMYSIRSDLREAFDIGTRAGRTGLNNWLFNFGKYDLRAVKHEYGGVLTQPQASRGFEVHGTYRKGGINILGYGRGELGIGEDVRMASRAFSTQSIDQCVPHIPIAIGSRQHDASLRNYETREPLYNTNLIFLPHYETIRLAATSRDAILGRRFNIACWQWELPRFPKGLELSIELVDEIWSCTAFAANAMRSATDKPVFVMPTAVALPALMSIVTRAELGLSEDSFIFLTIFDGSSGIFRKNPLATIKAFQCAFPESETGVHLLLKTMNVNQSPEWEEILRICQTDKRITLIAGVIPRERVIAIQNICDCFISLHRAEGFGRNIAEAMLLGKPVIVSNFSGNTDFTTQATAYLVEGKTVSVRPNEYSFADGQFWWDADVGHAAEMMRLCRENGEERERIAAAGQGYIHTHYSPESVGVNYIERLKLLGHLH